MSGAGESARFDTQPIVVDNLGRLEYHEAWALQRQIATERADSRGSDRLLLLEHPSVYTAGRRTAPQDRPTDGTPVIDVDRGGKITWHGPGQLVGYPIVKLAEPVDVVKYVRRLEEALIEVCVNMGVVCGRVEGRSGVWLSASMNAGRGASVATGDVRWRPERKIAAIGVRVQRGVAMHGFALNCNPALNAFDTIIPCGIADAGVTSLSLELGRDVPIEEVTPAVAVAITRALDGALPVAVHGIDRITFDEAAAEPTFTTLRFG